MFHYTDRAGWKAIRSQVDWEFQVHKPQRSDRPEGAYFTELEPSSSNLRTLWKRLRLPREKQEYVFWFEGTDGLIQLNEGRGRDRYIYFSPVEYIVVKERQRGEGATSEFLERFDD
jgi:hypothetical protein